MSLTTFSIFYFDYETNEDVKYLDFKEGTDPESTISISANQWSPEELADEIQDQMNSVGTYTYTVTFNRSTRTFTITGSSIFTLYVSGGSHSSTNIMSLIGFSGANRTGLTTYTGNLVTGSVYEPQFILQDHISSEDKKRSVDATIRKTANGELEVVKFGTESFVQVNIKYANSIHGDGKIIKYNPTGVDDLRAFMQYLITKGPVEFMADISDRNTFQILRLESTTDNKDGLGYELKELYDKGLPNYFESGKLLFRVED